MMAFVALGSNLGDRAKWIARGVAGLGDAAEASHVIATTPEQTAPLGGMDQPVYLNAMVRLDWAGDAESLLATCHRIEQEAGRERVEHWASRTLDLDIVRFGDQMCDLPHLTLPHPGLRDREFWARHLARLEQHG